MKQLHETASLLLVMFAGWFAQANVLAEPVGARDE